MPRLVRSATPKAASINATAAQIRFAFTLATERGWATDLGEATLTDTQGNVYHFVEVEKGTTSLRKASAFIDALKSLPRPPKPDVAPEPAKFDIEDGIYFRDGVVYKVVKAVHGTGRSYAKALDPESGRFEYAAGAIRTLTASHLMTREQASEFGHLYGICCRCGATLTDETSIELGIGPVCGNRARWAR